MLFVYADLADGQPSNHDSNDGSGAFSTATEGSTPGHGRRSSQHSLLFPPLSIADTGIAIDQDNLFKGYVALYV